MKGHVGVSQAGVIQPGIKPGIARVLVKNKSYCAYMSSNAILVYELPQFRPVSMICFKKTYITGFALAPGHSDLLAISYSDRTMKIIQCTDHKQRAYFSTPEYFVSIEWGAKHNEIFCFSVYFESFYIYNIADQSMERVQIPHLMNFRHLLRFPKNPGLLLGGNNNGRFALLNVYDQTYRFIEKNDKIRGVDIDPRVNERCLCVWETGGFAIIDFTDTSNLTVLAEETDLPYEFSSCCTLEKPVGHFLTGDDKTGIIRLWNPASRRPIEVYQVASSGISFLLRLTSSKVAVAFHDGMFGVFCMKRKVLIFQTKSGHSSGIVGCGFTSTKHHIFITGATEGTVCAWDTEAFKQVDKFTQSLKKKYMSAITISAGGGFAVSGYSDGKISFFSMQTHQKLFTLRLHTKAIKALSFSPINPNILLTAGADQKVIIYDVEKRIILTSIEVRGIPTVAIFSPHNEMDFAVGTSNGSIDIRSKDKVQIHFQMTDQSIAGICYSPFDKNILVSTTSSGYIQKWNASQESLVSNFRLKEFTPSSIAWNSFMKDVIVCGTKDGEIVIVNIRRQKKITRFYGHYSSIRTIRFHPDHPFEFFTVSRDITIKKWMMDKFFFKEIASQLFDKKIVKRMQYFRPIDGSGQLSRIVNFLNKNYTERVQFEEGDICPFSVQVEIANEKTEKKLKLQKGYSLMKRAIQRKKILQEASLVALHSGNITKYCEFLFDVGEYDKAIAAAPAVSFSFWKELTERKMKHLSGDEKIDTAIISGHVEEAVKMLMDQNRDDEAFTTAMAKKEGFYGFEEKINIQPPKPRDQVPQIQSNQQNSNSIVPLDFNTTRFFTEYIVASKRAKFHSKQGEPLLVAASFLSAGDTESALIRLLNNAELFYAIEIDLALGLNNWKVREQFVKICIVHNIHIDKAFELLNPKSQYKLAALTEFEEPNQRFEFYKSIKIYPFPEAVTLKDQIHIKILSAEYDEAVDMFLLSMKKTLLEPMWDWEEARGIVEEMELINMTKISKLKMVEVLAISFYVAAFEGMWKGFCEAGKYLNKKTEELIKKNDIKWMMPLLEKLKFIQKRTHCSKARYPIAIANYDLMNTYIPNSKNENVKRGPAFFVHSKNQMTLEQAAMWFNMTPFSPMCDGEIFFVF